jgi:hypothetical protein
MRYEYFGPDGRRRSETYDDQTAAQRIGERVMIGFDMTHRYVDAPDGSVTSVTYFQSEITGNAWAIYF